QGLRAWRLARRNIRGIAAAMASVTAGEAEEFILVRAVLRIQPRRHPAALLGFHSCDERFTLEADTAHHFARCVRRDHGQLMFLGDLDEWTVAGGVVAPGAGPLRKGVFADLAGEKLIERCLHIALKLFHREAEIGGSL